jgi:hypothetical protein
MTEPNFLPELDDFSLVLGGPIFQLFRRSHLAGDGLELLHRRIITITVVAWLPLLILATIGSSAGSVSRLSFFHDIEVHVRFLIALPVLIAAEILCSFANTSCGSPFRGETHRFAGGPSPLSHRNPVSR